MSRHGVIGWPRKFTGNDRDETCKGTKRGAIHYVNPSGTGGYARKLNRVAKARAFAARPSPPVVQKEIAKLPSGAKFITTFSATAGAELVSNTTQEGNGQYGNHTG